MHNAGCNLGLSKSSFPECLILRHGIFLSVADIAPRMIYNMEFLNPHKQTGIQPATGKLLIAEPMLGDPSFSRSVVLLCEHGPEGTVGFSLNRPTEHTLGD